MGCDWWWSFAAHHCHRRAKLLFLQEVEEIDQRQEKRKRVSFHVYRHPWCSAGNKTQSSKLQYAVCLLFSASCEVGVGFQLSCLECNYSDRYASFYFGKILLQPHSVPH